MESNCFLVFAGEVISFSFVPPEIVVTSPSLLGSGSALVRLSTRVASALGSNFVLTFGLTFPASDVGVITGSGSLTFVCSSAIAFCSFGVNALASGPSLASTASVVGSSLPNPVAASASTFLALPTCTASAFGASGLSLGTPTPLPVVSIPASSVSAFSGSTKSSLNRFPSCCCSTCPLLKSSNEGNLTLPSTASLTLCLPSVALISSGSLVVSVEPSSFGATFLRPSIKFSTVCTVPPTPAPYAPCSTAPSKVSCSGL